MIVKLMLKNPFNVMYEVREFKVLKIIYYKISIFNTYYNFAPKKYTILFVWFTKISCVQQLGT